MKTLFLTATKLLKRLLFLNSWLHHRRLICNWTCLHFRGMICCTWSTGRVKKTGVSAALAVCGQQEPICWSKNVYTIWTWAAPGRVYTTEAIAAPGPVNKTGVWTTPGRVCTAGACTGLKMSLPYGPGLHLDVFLLQWLHNTGALTALGFLWTKGAWADLRRDYTTGAMEAPGRLYTKRAWTVPHKSLIKGTPLYRWKVSITA
jgi:hypothetical protein